MKPIMDTGQLVPGNTPTARISSDRRFHDVATGEAPAVEISRRGEVTPSEDDLPRSGELQEVAVLEDPYFGGFQVSERDHTRCPSKPPWKRNPPATMYPRVWGRVDLTAERFGARVRLQVAARRWAFWDTEAVRAERERYHQRLLASEGGRRLLAGWEAERIEFKRALLEAPMPPPEISREWFCHPVSWPGPTAVIGARRFPKLPALTKLVPAPLKTEFLSAAERRARLDRLVAAYKGEIRVCPPETITKKPKKRMGRPPIGDRAMTDAQRARRSYWNKVRILKGDGHDGSTRDCRSGRRDSGQLDRCGNQTKPRADENLRK